jgi:hypothetical protein
MGTVGGAERWRGGKRGGRGRDGGVEVGGGWEKGPKTGEDGGRVDKRKVFLGFVV